MPATRKKRRTAEGTVRRTKITDPEERRRAVLRASKRVKTTASLDFVREVRGH